MCLWQPAIEIGPPPDWGLVDAALARLEEFHWLVFSSANGVRYLLDRLLARGGDLRRLAEIQLAAIGPGTAEELRPLPSQGRPGARRISGRIAGRGLVADARGQRFLLARASRGREVLAEELIAAGGIVEQVVVYTSRDVEQADPEIAAALAAGRIDWITVTSSAIARSLVEPLRRRTPQEQTRQHQPHHVGHAPRTRPRTGGRGARIHDGRGRRRDSQECFIGFSPRRREDRKGCTIRIFALFAPLR